MLEFLTYKKFKKSKAEKADKAATAAKESVPSSLTLPATDKPTTSTVDVPMPQTTTAITATAPKDDSLALVLRQEDESFFHNPIDWDHFISTPDDAASRPPPPPRPSTDTSNVDSPETSKQTLGATDKQKKKNRFSSLFRRDSKVQKPTGLIAPAENLASDTEPQDPSASGTSGKFKKPVKKSESGKPTPDEAASEASELASVLDSLNLSATNNRAFSLSTESTALVRRFTLILQDLINGVPTAADDLKALVNDTDGTLARSYEKLPSGLKKLVSTMPEKITQKMGPEMAAAAAKSQGVVLETEGKAAKVVAKEAAKKVFATLSLSSIVENPMIIVDMLKGILSVLKTRWPAFIGTNAVLSVALFLLLFVLWYCHKRGREVRLEKEDTEAQVVAGENPTRETTVLVDAADVVITKTPATPALPEGAGQEEKMQKMLEGKPRDQGLEFLHKAKGKKEKTEEEGKGSGLSP